MTEPRPAPYPADTLAKGWKFEVDSNAVDQSETWPLAAEIPMAQHALLMMWYVAWTTQKPCGSFPNNENTIRAVSRIPPAVWAKCRDVCMRGWWLADDGRLYHDTLTKRVLEMMKRRRSDSDRQAANRARTDAESDGSHDGVTRDPPVTTDGLGTDSSTENGEQRTSQDKPVRKRPARASALPCPDDVDPKVWGEWLDLRRKKRAPVGDTVIASAREQAGLAGLTFERFLQLWIFRGTQGLMADWLKPNERGPGAGAVIPINRQEAQEARNRAVGERWLAEQEALDARR